MGGMLIALAKYSAMTGGMAFENPTNPGNYPTMSQEILVKIEEQEQNDKIHLIKMTQSIKSNKKSNKWTHQ